MSLKHASYMVAYPIADTTPMMTLWREKATNVLQLVTSTEGLSFPGEPHIMLCPPWRSSLDVARKLHHELLASDIAENHTDLRLGELAFFVDENKREDILYIDIKATQRLSEQIKQLRTKLHANQYLRFVEEDFDAHSTNIRLHLTICTGRNLASLPLLQKFIKMYNKQKNDPGNVVRVGTVHAQMYTQYDDGWKLLHDNSEHTSRI